MNYSKLFYLTLGIFLTATNVNAGKILAVYVFPGKSHHMMHNALIKELISRGHEVTFITNFSIKENLGANYTEVLIDPVYNFWAEVQDYFQADNIFDLTNMPLSNFLKMLDIIGISTTEHALKQPKIQQLFNRQDSKNAYDLLIAEQFFQEAFLALALKYDIPVITTSTVGWANYMSQMMGVLTPWSFVPHLFQPFDDKMNFYERIQNTFASMYDDFYREYVYFPKQDALVKKYLSHLPIDIPKVSRMEKNISAMLMNSYAPLTTPRPTVLGMVEVGGMHIYPPKPLPGDIRKFLDEATDGAIYFSLGSNIQSADMPPEKLKMFIEVFASLKQRVLWKFEDEKIPMLPKNVMVKNWLPQSDILAHSNVKVFLTHGGLFGTQEGVYYGIPMLGLPIYCDQFLNMKKASKSGYAITLSFPTITKDDLRASLVELIENPLYRNNVKHFSQIFRDRPLSARDTAMYWVEYVIRYKGAPHIRSAGRNLAWYEFYLLDVIGLVIVGVTIAAACIFMATRILVGNKKVKKKTS